MRNPKNQPAHPCSFPCAVRTCQHILVHLKSASTLGFSKNQSKHPGSVKSSQYALVQKKPASPKNVAVSEIRLQKTVAVSEIRRGYTFTPYLLYTKLDCKNLWLSAKTEKPASAPWFSKNQPAHLGPVETSQHTMVQ